MMRYLMLFGFVLSIAQAEDINEDNNIRILSDEMECDQNQRRCIATGNAIAEKVNDPKKQSISAHKLTAYFSEKTETKQSQLERIDAEGDVVVTTGDTIIRGPRGTYRVNADKTIESAEIFEDVRVSNDKNQVNGTYGHVDMVTGKYTIQQEPGRQVEALVFTQKKDK